jgi:uncharacterized phage protein gp47/JayE
VSYVPRQYDEIVVDALTTLTGGTVRESMLVPSSGDLPKLANRPVRRISHLLGQIAGKDNQPIDYKFTGADFELVSSSGGPDKDLIRFRDGGRRPIAGSTLTVNYYPAQTAPVPLTDLNVGSVVRTLLESIARELAVTYLHLQKVYDSAFLDTAEGSSLDRVVALVGIIRLPPDRPVARVTFSRRPDSPGRITVPAGTAVTDAKANRYLTAAEFTLEPNESSLEVLVVGDSAGTKPVSAGELSRLEIAVAGISSVTNEQAARLPGAPETDDDLRRRARGALHGAVRGTVDALKFGLLSLAGVKSVDITEAPNGVPGEIAVSLAFDGEASPELLAGVQQRIDEFRPAGVRVVRRDAAPLTVDLSVQLTLAGTGLPASELGPLTAAIGAQLKSYLGGVAPGGTARRSKLQAIALGDARVQDARVVLQPAGGTETEELALQPGQVIAVGAVQFPTPTAEQAPTATVTVSVILPLHLVGATTQAEAQDVLNKSVATWLTKSGPDLPLSVDALLGAVRDETRFAIVRAQVVMSVERGDRFWQLTDGQGSYTPAPTETLQVGKVDLQVREGTV